MKLRFDTYTKDLQTATQAFTILHKHCDDITLSKSSYADAINLHGEIDSRHVNVLEEATSNDFNDDYSQL